MLEYIVSKVLQVDTSTLNMVSLRVCLPITP